MMATTIGGAAGGVNVDRRRRLAPAPAWLLQNGESVYVRAQMGHASIKMTVDLYGRWLKPEPIRGGVNYLDSFTRRF